MFGSVVYIGTLVFDGFMGLFMAYAAYSLFTWTPPVVAKAREELRMPRWFWILAGTVATVGAAGLLTGLTYPVIGALAAVWMVCYFVVASLVHITRNDIGNIAPALVFLVLATGLVALRWGDLAPVLHLL